MTWIAVAAGGALGSVARHAVNRATGSARFPLGTVIVNLVGCLLIGVLAGLLASRRIALPPHWREFVFVGLLGGFTTFSSFAGDVYAGQNAIRGLGEPQHWSASDRRTRRHLDRLPTLELTAAKM